MCVHISVAPCENGSCLIWLIPCLCQGSCAGACTLLSISTWSTSAGLPCARAPPVCQDAGDASPGQVQIFCRAAHRARHSQLECPIGDAGMLLPDIPSRPWWKHLSAAHTVLGEGAGMLVRGRKCQPSPRSGKQAVKGLTILLKSHMPGAAVSFHPCPWGPACLSPFVSIPSGVTGRRV